jgi:hypothetical protein
MKPDRWIVLDNSSSPQYDWSPAKELPWVDYVREEEIDRLVLFELSV